MPGTTTAEQRKLGGRAYTVSIERDDNEVVLAHNLKDALEQAALLVHERLRSGQSPTYATVALVGPVTLRFESGARREPGLTGTIGPQEDARK